MAFVCLCSGVTSRQLRDEIRGGACTLDEIGRRCGAGACCHGCHPTIEAMLERSAVGRRNARIATA